MATFSMMYNYGMMWKCMLLCFIDPRVRKIRNEASSCLGIFSRTLGFWLAASGVSSAAFPPLAIGVGPEVIGVHFFHIFLKSDKLSIFSLEIVQVLF